MADPLTTVKTVSENEEEKVDLKDLQIDTKKEAQATKLSKDPSTPLQSSWEQCSYYEGDSVETLQTSDNQTWTFRTDDKKPRRVYFSMKIKRFSDIDNVRESFRCRFHLYLNWIITHKEYEKYLTVQRGPKKYRHLWEPKFYPRIEFVNNVEEHHFEVVGYPPQGKYRVLKFSTWLDEKDCGFDCQKTLFLRKKLECDYTFSEQMELRTFPFDCQDFTVVVRESSGTKKALLLPEPRYTSKKRQYKSDFFKLDPTFSVLDEWDFHSIMLEVADSSSGSSRSKSVYKEVTVRFKLKRRWVVYFYNITIYFMVITFLALTCFALDKEDVGERLNLAVVILLTLVAFQHTVFSKLPNIPYLTFMHKYIILSFIFVCVVILESSFVPIATTSNDDGTNPDFAETHTTIPFDVSMSWLFSLYWILYHVYFILRSGWHRHQQSRKLSMDSDEIAKHVEEKYPQFLLSWKSLMDIEKCGGYEKWLQKEQEMKYERQESEREKIKRNKALCVMEFGGKNGEILSFASYAQKEAQKDVTFCGYVGDVITSCFVSCVSCCFCECCQGKEARNRNKSISQKKSEAFAE